MATHLKSPFRQRVGIALLAAITLLLTACGGGGSSAPAGGLTGFVQDAGASGGSVAVASATVTVRRSSDGAVLRTTTSGAAGQYTLAGLPLNVALVVTATPPAPAAAGFGTVRRFPSSQSLTLTGSANTRVDFTLGGATGYDLTPTAATTLGVGGSGGATDGSQVDLPANALVRSGGAAPAGDVSVFLQAIDVSAATANFNTAGLDAFPGNMTGVAAVGGATTDIASFGALSVEFFDKTDNAPLQLAAGQTATIRIAVPAALQASAPATIPLWWFNTATGLWVEEGSATLDAGGTYYEGDVSHFSTWNADVPITVASVTGTVQYADASAAAGVVVRVRGVGYGYQRIGVTDSNGLFSIPAQRGMSIEIDVLAKTPETFAAGPVANAATWSAGTLVLGSNPPIAGDTVVTQEFTVAPGADVGLFMASGTVLDGFDAIRGTDIAFTISNDDLKVTLPFAHGLPGSGDPANGIQRITGTSFAALTTAPASGYENPACFSAPPACAVLTMPFTVVDITGGVPVSTDFTSVFAARTAAGFYGKLQVTAATRDAGTGVYTVTVKYKMNLDGSRNL